MELSLKNSIPSAFEEFSKSTEKKYVNKALRMSISTAQNFRIRFNVEAAQRLKLEGGMLKFFRFEKNWYVVKTHDDGYNVSVEKSHRTGATVSATIPAQNIVKDLEAKAELSEFYLLESEYELGSFPLYQIHKISK